MKKILSLLILSLLLSSCSSNPSKEVSKNEEKITDTVPAVSAEVGAIKDTESGLIYNENDGDLIPGDLKIEDINVFQLNLICENEGMPEIISRVSLDFDLDGAKDAAIVSKCGEQTFNTVTIFRATSRGWWNKMSVDPSFKDTKIIGSCEAKESYLYCEAIMENKISNINKEGLISVNVSDNEWVIAFIES
jgi:hypothetical protein